MRKAENKDIGYVININSAEDKKGQDKEINPKREFPKVDKYMTLIGQLLHVNSSLSNPNNAVTDNIDGRNDTRKMLVNVKNNNTENQEQKFSISQLKDKSENLETHKKGFFVISEEIKEEEDDMSLKLKRELLVSKIIYDKSIIIDKPLQAGFNDGVLSSVFLALSCDSRKILNENMIDSINDFNTFHNVIGFDKEKALKNFQVTNESILNMCENFVKFEDLQNFDGDINPSGSINYDKKFSSIVKPQLEKFLIFDDEKKLENNTSMFYNGEIKNEQQIEITRKPEVIEDEEFDIEGYNFFLDFIKKNENHPIKEKVEKILDIFKSNQINNSKVNLSNKIKNEILRNLKEEYLHELEELEKIEEQKRKEREREEELNKKRNFRIENPFVETLDNEKNRSKVNKSINNSNSHTPNKNKIIYTQQGWGIADHQVKKNVPINSGKYYNNEKYRQQSPKNKIDNKLLKSKANDKLDHNKFYNENQIKRKPGNKVIQRDNQKIIYSNKNNHIKNHPNNTKNDIWIGEQESDESSGEWVDDRRYK